MGISRSKVPMPAGSSEWSGSIKELLFCWSNWGIAALPLLHLAEKWWDVASRYHFEKKQHVHLSTWGISGICFCSFQNFQHSLWVLFVAVSTPWPWRDPNLFESTCSEVAIGSYKHATLWCFEYWYWKVPTSLFAKKVWEGVYMYKFISIYRNITSIWNCQCCWECS